MTCYFLFAGEASGDLHGSHLMDALVQQDPSCFLCGVGGPLMRKKEFECILPMENFQVMGLTDVLLALPRLWHLFYQVRDDILKMDPDVVILIDYPGFNLRLAKALRKKGFKGKIVQYICPTIWAHGAHRVELLNRYVDLLLTIYPFEAAYFSNSLLQVKYIGNPLVDTVQRHTYNPHWLENTGLSLEDDIIALFPGSRQGEIERHLPQQLQVASLLKKRHPHLRFAIACAQDSLKAELLKLAETNALNIKEDLFFIPPQYRYELMKTCKTALAKSGTVTLELALHQVPTVVHYQLSLLNYLFAKYYLKLNLPHYCIVNILAQSTVFPERMGRKIEVKDLISQVEHLHFEKRIRHDIQSACQDITQLLTKKSSHALAAEAIWKLLS